MKRYHFTPNIKIIICIFLLLSIGSCREDESSDKNEGAGYGTIPVNIIWQSSPTKEKQVAGYPPAIEESDASSADKVNAKSANPKYLGHIIKKMKIIISAADMPDMVAIFNYNDHRGVIHNVPVGTGRKIKCEGLDLKNYVRYKGERTGIEVVKGENSTVDIKVDKQNIKVSPSGLYNTIQSAIDAADNNETIEVLDGEYKENIVFSDKLITVRSINGPDHVSIGNSGVIKSVVTFNEISSATSIILEGFTIRKGYAKDGGGIYCNNSSPKITGCIISENRTMRGVGGGMACYNGSSPELINCIIKSNTGSDYGGGIYCEQSSPTIRNCNIRNNEAYAAGGIGIENSSDITIINCKINDNTTDHMFETSAAIVFEDSTATLINSIIANHNVVFDSYGYGTSISNSLVEIINCNIINNFSYGVSINDGTLDMVNSIIWSNGRLPQDQQIRTGGNVSVNVSYSDIQNGWGSLADMLTNYNINSDPKFKNNTYFCLSENSPCKDTGTNDIDIHPALARDMYGRDRGEPYDMGVYEYRTNDQVSVRNMYSTIQSSDEYNSIQSAINIAPPCECEVIVGPGRYKENINFLGKWISVKSTNGPEETTIDGNLRDRVVTFATGESDSSIFSGFKIVNGFSFVSGGGIYVHKDSTPKISNCIIRSNFADIGGGVVVNNNSTTTITDCTIRDNMAALGGGIYVYDNSWLTINNSVISSNEASYGGGIYLSDNSRSTISNSVISSNNADVNGGGISSSATFAGGDVDLEITNSTIDNNKSGETGGGIGFLAITMPTITNSTIRKNSASYGGGIYCFEADAKFNYCTINNNSVSNIGGGAYLSGETSLTIENCTITSNKASSGGGISTENGGPVIISCIITSNHATSDGGGIFCKSGSSYPIITNCSISENSADGFGGGIKCDTGKTIGVGLDPNVTNSILWGNTAGGNPSEIHLTSPLSSITVSYSVIDPDFITGGIPTLLDNITGNPLFVGGGNYHLQLGSRCIDAASSDSPAPAKDKDGKDRCDDPDTPNTGTGINGDYYDIGAYEYDCPPP